MARTDPYLGLAIEDWRVRTLDLIEEHPLEPGEVVDTVLDAWDRILTTRIAGELDIGVDVKPPPQMMGSFLDSVIAVDLAKRHPGVWRPHEAKSEKDLVYLPDDYFSTEIKTSSHKTQVFGNRSYAQPSLPGTKVRDGYYITINFERFQDHDPPRIRRVGMGWLNHNDWVPQASPTGQQAAVRPAARVGKIVEIYSYS
ncbi:MAG TPA: ScaI family restriction endonuclease [Mycobacteriales bacterium]|nr:ScaI family restriction endonuclease [Mycobacteriales bacterium]